MAVCGFGAYGAAALHAGAPAAIHLALVSATLPFLVANLPPARVFMGDGGSVPLGFLAAVLGLAGVHAHTWPAWFPLLVFLPFIADTLVTVIRRIIAGENLFQAHKTHYYQRLHRMGAGHAGTLLFYGVLVAGTSASAYLALATRPAAGWQVLGAWSVAIGSFSPALIIIGADAHQGSDDKTPKLQGVARTVPRPRGHCPRLGRDVPRPLQSGFQGALSRGHDDHAGVDPAAAGHDLRRVRPVPRPVALREPARPCSASSSPRVSARC
jgi:hypothetical protein